MKTYPEMNVKIVDLLRMSENPRCLYAAARIEELEKKIAALMADLQERDQALHVESEALGSADDRAEELEQALERACKYFSDIVFDCPPGNKYGNVERKGCDWSNCYKCWKKYFLEGDSDA